MKTEKQIRLGMLADAIEYRLQQNHMDDELKALLRKMYGHLAKTSNEKSAQYSAGYQEGYADGHDTGLDAGFEEGKLFNTNLPFPLVRIVRRLRS